MTLVQWVLAMVVPILSRAVIALGFTAVTFVGVEVLAQQLIEMAKTSWNAIPATVLQLATLSGIPEALGIIIGAYVARLSVWTAINGVKLVLRR